MINKCPICNNEFVFKTDSVGESQLVCTAENHVFTWLYENKETDVTFCLQMYDEDKRHFQNCAWFHYPDYIMMDVNGTYELRIDHFSQDYEDLKKFFKSFYLGEGFEFL